MILRVVTTLAALALTGCSAGMLLSPAIESWEAEVHGVPIRYKLVTGLGNLGGSAAWFGGVCTIAIDAGLLDGLQVVVASHEVGHCLDLALLDFDHNGWRDEGCVFGSYYCSPWEGFAEGYSEAYLATCLYARRPLGLLPDDGIDCEPPHPRDVTPGSVLR